MSQSVPFNFRLEEDLSLEDIIIISDNFLTHAHDETPNRKRTSDLDNLFQFIDKVLTVIFEIPNFKERIYHDTSFTISNCLEQLQKAISYFTPLQMLHCEENGLTLNEKYENLQKIRIRCCLILHLRAAYNGQ